MYSSARKDTKRIIPGPYDPSTDDKIVKNLYSWRMILYLALPLPVLPE